MRVNLNALYLFEERLIHAFGRRAKRANLKRSDSKSWGFDPGICEHSQRSGSKHLILSPRLCHSRAWRMAFHKSNKIRRQNIDQAFQIDLQKIHRSVAGMVNNLKY